MVPNHAEFDRYPLLLESLAEEFGTDGILSIAERFIEAEAADFYWDGRFAERKIGRHEGFDEDDTGGEIVAIIGYFRSGYYVASCIVDAQRHVLRMLRLIYFDSFDGAETAFVAGGE